MNLKEKFYRQWSHIYYLTRECNHLGLKPLLASIIFIILLIALSGCSTKNTGVPTPAPTPTITPTPTPNPADVIIGRWEGYHDPVTHSIEFFRDGTLIYNNGGNMAQGFWKNVGNGQYHLSILIYETDITLNNDKTQFSYGTDGIIMTKKRS